MGSYSLPNIVAQSGTFKVTLYSDDAGLTAPTAQTIISIGQRAEGIDKQLGRAELTTLDIEIIEDYSTYATDGFWATWMATVYNGKSPQVKITLDDDGTDREFFWGVVDTYRSQLIEEYRDGTAHIRRMRLALVDILTLVASVDIPFLIYRLLDNDAQYEYWTATNDVGPTNPPTDSAMFAPLSTVIRSAVSLAFGQTLADTTLTLTACDFTFIEKFTGYEVNWDDLYIITDPIEIKQNTAWINRPSSFTSAGGNIYYCTWGLNSTYPPKRVFYELSGVLTEMSEGDNNAPSAGQWYYDSANNRIYVQGYNSGDPSSGGFVLWAAPGESWANKYTNALDLIGDILRQCGLVMRRTFDGTYHVIELYARKRSVSTETTMDGGMTASSYIPGIEEAITTADASLEWNGSTYAGWSTKRPLSSAGLLGTIGALPASMQSDMSIRAPFYARGQGATHPDDCVALFSIRAIEADFDNDGAPFTTETAAIPIHLFKYYHYGIESEVSQNSQAAVAAYYVNSFQDADGFEREYASLKGTISGTTTFYNMRPGMKGVIDGTTYYARSVELDPMTDSARVKWIS